MSETSARASRRAFWLGSFARKGLIGLRCTTAGAGAGVDGVEKAADTFPLGANPGDPVGFAGDCGILVRDGGVSGAPNVAPVGATGFESSDAAPEFGAFGFSTVAGTGEESFTTDGVNLGENGGVRCRTGAGDWLGGGVGAGRGAAGAGRCGAAGVGAGGGAARGIGGGQAFAGIEAAGVLPRDMIGFTPPGVGPAAAAVVAPAENCRSSPQVTAAPTGMSPPQTEHRARMETLVIFAGSRRKTERHSGQETFI